MDKFIADIVLTPQGQPRRHLSVGCLRRRCLHWRRRRRTPGRVPPVGREHVWSRRGSFLPGSRHCLLFLGKTRRTRLKWMKHRPRPCSAGHLASPRHVVDPESSRPGTATSADWFSGPDDLGWPLRSVRILRRSSLMTATSPPLLRRTHALTSPYHRRFRRWPAVWHWRTSPNSCLRCPPRSHGVDGPVSLRSSLLSSWGPRMQRSRLCCQHRCASSHHLVPGCRRKCCHPLVSLGDQWTMPSRPCSPTGTHHGVSYPSSSIALHFGAYGAVAPGGSVPCADTTIIG